MGNSPKQSVFAMVIWNGFPNVTRLEPDNDLIATGKWDNVNPCSNRTLNKLFVFGDKALRYQLVIAVDYGRKDITKTQAF